MENEDTALSMEEMKWQIICGMLARIGMVSCFPALILTRLFRSGNRAWNDYCTFAAVFLVWTNVKGIRVKNGVVFVQFSTSFSFE